MLGIGLGCSQTNLRNKGELLTFNKNGMKNFFLLSDRIPQKLNPIQDKHFRGCSRMVAPNRLPLPKICHTYPTMMKLGAVIPYPKKMQKIFKSRDTPLEFCWHQDFFTGNQQILLYKEIQISIVFLCTISIYFNFSWVSIDFYKKHG